ncbi:MAG TPA: putative DNA-binding domain-containing protein [Lysobacter sp.]
MHDNSVHDTLREQQFMLAAHLRDPRANPPPPGIEARRLRVYRELFFDSIEGLLAGGFPVIRQTLGVATWKALVREFYAGHRSRTPLFTQVAGEFVAFLGGRDNPEPWLAELAHYEWMEQALFTSDAQPAAHDPGGDLLEGVPVLSPLALPLAYRWPVAEIGPGHVPRVAPDEPTLLLVQRDVDHEVRFTRLAPLAFGLLDSLEANAWTGREHLAVLAAQAGADPASMLVHGQRLLESLRAQGVVVGTAA